MPVTIQNPNDHDVVVDGITFTLSPEKFEHFLSILAFARRTGIDGESAGIAGGMYSIVKRVHAWKGVVLPDGKDAPCDDVHKELFFGQNPGFIRKISAELEKSEADSRKNSEASPGE